MSRISLFAVLLVAILAVNTATAGTITYFEDNDPGASTLASAGRTTTAHTSWLNALTGAPSGTITFESESPTTATTITNLEGLGIGYGVTLTGVAPAGLTISDAPSGTGTGATDTGYNTTVGGHKFLQVNGINTTPGQTVTVTFTFGSAISAFGAYITGTQTNLAGVITITFSDGTSQTHTLAKNNSAVGGIQFFGFTDQGGSITSITFTEAGTGFTNTSNDQWGIDDVSFGNAGAGPGPGGVPEPATFVLSGLGLVSAMAFRRLRRKA